MLPIATSKRVAINKDYCNSACLLQIPGCRRGLGLPGGDLLLPDRLLRPHSQLRHRAADRQVDDGRLHALLLGLHPRPVLPLLRHTGILCLLYTGQAIRDNI